MADKQNDTENLGNLLSDLLAPAGTPPDIADNVGEIFAAALVDTFTAGRDFHDTHESIQ